MWLLILAIGYCAIKYIFNISTELCFGMYVIPIMVLKGMFSKSLGDVFSTKTIGTYLNKNAVYEFLSLLLMTIMYFFSDLDSYTIIDIVVGSILFILMYRFMMLGTIQTLKNTKGYFN